jgi:hypothetical protein
MSYANNSSMYSSGGRILSVGLFGVIVLKSASASDFLQFQEIRYDYPDERPTLVHYGLDSVAFGEGTWVAVGDGIFASANGVDWTQVLSRNTAIPNLNSVIYAQGRFVAVGGGVTRSGSYPGQCVIMTSQDGLSWRTVYNDKVTTEANALGVKDIRLRTVAHGPNGFVALGMGSGMAVLTSSDGVFWTKNETTVLRDVQSSMSVNGLFIACGPGISTSANGIDWVNQIVVPDENPFMSSGYSAGLFVLGGGGTRGIWESQDGTNWVQKSSFVGNVWGVAGGGGEFIAVSTEPAILQRTTSGSWRSSPCAPHWRGTGICYGDGQFIIVGEHNLILRAVVPPPELSISSASSSETLTLKTKGSTELSISHSDDLVSWSQETNVLTPPDGVFTLDRVETKTQRFFKATLK